MSRNSTICKENIFVTLNEKFDFKKMNEILLSGILDDSYNRSLLKYLRYSKRITDQIYYNKVSYTIPENGIGRMQAIINKLLMKKQDGTYIKLEKTCITQSHMWNQVKSYILKDLYYDVDIHNCQPFILEQLMIKNNIDNKYINIYNNNREKLFKQMMDKFKIDKRQVKNIMYKLMFGGGIGSLKEEDLPKDIKNFIAEIKKVTLKLLEIYLIYKEEAIKQKGANYWNINGTALSFLLQTEERKILQCMFNFFNMNGYTVGATLFDGIHLEKNKVITNDILKKCSKFINKTIGYMPIIKIKEFDNVELTKIDPNRNFDLLNKNMLNNVSNLNIINFNDNNICPMGGNSFANINIINEENNKLKDIILIKAKTGDGKTYFLKQVHNYIKNNNQEIKEIYRKKIIVPRFKWRTFDPVNNPEDETIKEEKEFAKRNVKLLSLVSRVSLSYSHEKEFGIINYQNTNNHGLDEVYQLDSIDKFVNDNDDYYILFLDEVASLCSHFNNKMRKMTSKRIEMVEIFRKILNDEKCLQIIGCDDNMNNGTINFIRELTKRKIYLYINTHKNSLNTPVKIYTNMNKIIGKIKEDIKNGYKIFCCSNRNQKFFETVVRPIIDELKLQKDEYIIYSGNYGHKIKKNNNIISCSDYNDDELDEIQYGINTVDWNKPKIKIIFATPSILYGLSFDEDRTHKIYGIYYNKSPLNALDCNQQINRIRKPISIDLYIEKAIYYPYKDLETAEKYINDNLPEDIIINKKYLKIQTAIDNLFIYDEYLRSHLNDIYYYLPYLLKMKGYNNIIAEVESDDKQLKYTNLEYNNIIINEYNKNILDEKKTDDITIKLNSFGFNSQIVKNNNELLETENNIKEKVLNIFTNNKYFRCLELYKMKLDETYLDNLDLNNDTKLNKIYSDEYKIKLLDDLHKILKIEWFDIELFNKLQSNDNLLKPFKVNDDLHKSICHKKRFNIRGKKPVNYLDWIIFLLKRYTMFSLDFIINKKQNLYYNNKQYCVPILNTELTKKLNLILNYKEILWQIKEKSKTEYKPYEEYLF